MSPELGFVPRRPTVGELEYPGAVRGLRDRIGSGGADTAPWALSK